MPHEVIMPALGMAQDTGHIVAWHKAAGDKVATGDVLFEVETDKATMEVEAAGDGFLTNVRAAEGDDVPVGNVIALISETADGAGDSAEDGAAPSAKGAPAAADEPAPAPEPGPLPEGHEVIMPALGMAQDTGKIVAWAKAPGDAVATGDVLFEVETDKATMEVEAGHDGYLAAVLAQDGEDAPVGGVIAVISAGKPENPVSRSVADAAAAPTPAPAAAPRDAPAEPRESPTEFRRNSDDIPTPQKAPSEAPGGRVLASPKARRLAAERGLDLARLARAGHPQPYHAADVETLAALPEPSAQPAPAAGPQTHRIKARVPAKGLRAFLAWLAETGDPATASDALAALAAGALRGVSGDAPIRLRVERPGLPPETRDDPDLARAPAADDGAPALILRDLTGSRLTAIESGAAEAPVMTVAGRGSKIMISLDFSSSQMDADTAAQLADGFAARLEDPLRQLF